MVTCYMCDREQPENAAHAVDLFDSPFDDAPKTKWVCRVAPDEYYEESCFDALFSPDHTDFHYQTCSDCERNVCVRYPKNGWHEHFRYVHSEPVCLQCYEEALLIDGVDRDDIEEGRFTGMFFSHGNPEPAQAGYAEVGMRFIQSDDSIERVKAEILKLIDNGNRVVIGYERMAEGGGEGTISIHAKAFDASPNKGGCY